MPWAAAIGAVGSIAGGIISSQGAQSAASTNQAAQQWMEQSAQPFVNAGQGAIPSVQNLLGLGPQGSAGMMAQLQQMPGYQFTLGQGLNAVQNSMASQGLGVSGNALRGAAQYATGLASQTYQSQLNNLMSLANLGENAAVGAGSTIASTAANTGLAQQNAANLLGGGMSGAANTGAQALLASQGANYAQNNPNSLPNTVSSLFGGSSGSGGYVDTGSFD